MSVTRTPISRWFMRLAVVGSIVAMAACGALDSGPPLEELTASEIYARAETQLQNGQADDAAITFGEIERLYPYSELAARALIMQAFSYHRDEVFQSSRAASQRYLDFYPAVSDAP